MSGNWSGFHHVQLACSRDLLNWTRLGERQPFLDLSPVAGCASKKCMRKSWDFLTHRLKELGLSKHGHVLPSKAQFYEIRKAGPIAVVYPEGV